MIAGVIVDVPALHVDRIFDYRVSLQHKPWVRPGIRVLVPFGARKVQGFVVRLAEHSEYGQSLKEIEALLDLSPVLTEELIELGFRLAEKTLCPVITVFQSMLPAALRVKYQKEIRPSRNVTELDPRLQNLFHQKRPLYWKDLENASPDLIRHVQKSVQKGELKIIVHVRDALSVKKERVIAPAVSEELLKKAEKSLSRRAKKQRRVLRYFIESGNQEMNLNHLAETLDVSKNVIRTLVNQNLLQEREKEVYRNPYDGKAVKRTVAHHLTTEQKQIVEAIRNANVQKKAETFALFGITGSGKTEIYLNTIEHVLKNGQEAIVLVPEISLTPQMVERFKGRFGSRVAVLHSGLSRGEKYDEWRKIQKKEVQVAVGARSCVFAPFTNLGVIIVDEEHETTYKQEETPRYHAKDVAIFRGEYHRCPVVLGSATPSLETYSRGVKQVYTLCRLTKRATKAPLPSAKVVDMRVELREGNRSMFSRLLLERLKNRLEKGEQSVLLLNRRGYATFMICRDCGYVAECPHCDISLTYHKRQQMLLCHYCHFHMPLPQRCPACGGPHFRFFGTGTQKVEEELTRLLPEARVIRMDVDTTSRKGMHEKLLRQFAEKKADILLGTQMIAKGLDYPNVTFVGVLGADAILHFPDFRASEKTFQLLTQVAGRAGRHERPGEVVIQTYTPEHYSIQLAAQHNYPAFYRKEMLVRKKHGYPPYYFLILITVSDLDAARCLKVSGKIAEYLKKRVAKTTRVLGPVPSPIMRVKDRYRYHCMIKYKHDETLFTHLRAILEHYQQPQQKDGPLISVDTNPQTLQ